MAAPTLGDVLVALARLEAKQDAMMSAIERLREETDVHWKKILVGIIAVVGFGLAIFDRLYQTTP